jgi:hypothetical protein
VYYIRGEKNAYNFGWRGFGNSEGKYNAAGLGVDGF